MEIRRDFYLDKLIKRKNNGLIKVITGIRRCGKSYLLTSSLIRKFLKNKQCKLMLHSPIFKFSKEVRTAFYTTNAIESLNYAIAG